MGSELGVELIKAGPHLVVNDLVIDLYHGLVAKIVYEDNSLKYGHLSRAVGREFFTLALL